MGGVDFLVQGIQRKPCLSSESKEVLGSQCDDGDGCWSICLNLEVLSPAWERGCGRDNRQFAKGVYKKATQTKANLESQLFSRLLARSLCCPVCDMGSVRDTVSISHHLFTCMVLSVLSV